MTFGERLKQARITNGYTQQQVADAIGVAKSTVAGYEKGTREPDMSKIVKIIYFLHVNSDFLILGEDTEPAEQEPSYPKITTWKREYQEHYVKYTQLDQFGKKAIDSLTDLELARAAYEKQELDRVDHNNIIYLNISQQAASAGTGVYLFPEAFQQVKVTKNKLTKKAKFAVPVQGDSMIPDFYNGDILLVGEEIPNIGDFGVFTLDGEGYVKMLGDGILISSNSDYPNITMNENIRCNGKIIGTLKKDWLIENT